MKVNKAMKLLVSSKMHVISRLQRGIDFQRIINGFQRKWNFPQCLGAIDGTHIPIKAPLIYHSDYYNRKIFHSVILQGSAALGGWGEDATLLGCGISDVCSATSTLDGDFAATIASSALSESVACVELRNFTTHFSSTKELRIWTSACHTVWRWPVHS